MRSRCPSRSHVLTCPSCRCAVYIDSVRYSLSSSNLPQLSACLPHLVFDILPKVATAPPPPLPPRSTPASSDALSNSLADLSLGDQDQKVLDEETVVRYQSLYLLYLICHLADLAAYPSALLAFTAPPPLARVPTDTPDAWDDTQEEPATNIEPKSYPVHPHFAYTQCVFAALAANNYAAFAKLVPPATASPVLAASDARPPSTEPTSNVKIDSAPTSYVPPALHLAVARLAIPRLREQAWPAIAKSYKVFTDYEWLGRALLFPPGDAEGVMTFLKGKGLAVV